MPTSATFADQEMSMRGVGDASKVCAGYARNGVWGATFLHAEQIFVVKSHADVEPMQQMYQPASRPEGKTKILTVLSLSKKKTMK